MKIGEKKGGKTVGEIIIVDARCGKGKSSCMIDFINRKTASLKLLDTLQNFIYVSPFLSEGERVMQCCKRFRPFTEPEQQGKGKLNNLKQLIESGYNIVTTHALFKRIAASSSLNEVFKGQRYTLIIDEVLPVFEEVKVSQADFNLLLKGNLIAANDKGKISWLDPNYMGVHTWFKDLIEEVSVYHIKSKRGKHFLVKQMLPDIFSFFEQVYVLSYQFEASLMAAYFKFHKLNYRLVGVSQTEATGEYYFTKYCYDREEVKERVKPLVQIVHDQKLNSVGETVYSLSHNSLKEAPTAEIKQIKDHLYNYYYNRVKAKAPSIMWTTFKDVKEKLEKSPHKRGFIAVNARASNEYRDKTDLAYIANIFVSPSILGYLQANGIKVDRNRYALVELLQWLFRSALRKGERINLYVPSRRMRQLLLDWLDGKEIEQEYEAERDFAPCSLEGKPILPPYFAGDNREALARYFCWLEMLVTGRERDHSKELQRYSKTEYAIRCDDFFQVSLLFKFRDKILKLLTLRGKKKIFLGHITPSANDLSYLEELERWELEFRQEEAPCYLPLGELRCEDYTILNEQEKYRFWLYYVAICKNQDKAVDAVDAVDQVQIEQIFRDFVSDSENVPFYWQNKEWYEQQRKQDEEEMALYKEILLEAK